MGKEIEIKKANKVIAGYMGQKYPSNEEIEELLNGLCDPLEGMNYSESLDALFPVWNKYIDDVFKEKNVSNKAMLPLFIADLSILASGLMYMNGYTYLVAICIATSEKIVKMGLLK